MVERCADYGFDLLHDRVEVSPSAHYQMGGVRSTSIAATNLEVCSSPAKTPAACTAPIAWAATASPTPSFSAAAPAMPWRIMSRRGLPTSAPTDRRPLAAPSRPADDRLPFDAAQELEDLMWEQVGVVANGTDLESALAALAMLRDRADMRSYWPQPDPAWNATSTC